MGLRFNVHFISLLLLLTQSLAATNEEDTSGLQAISGGFTNANILNWRNNDPCGTRWQGINCTDTAVTILDLSEIGLEGRLLPSIGNLVNLKTLILAFNPKLGGVIPKEIARLVNLEYLSLQSCSFEGSIPPEIGGLKSLKFLGLNFNNLTGSIPPELGGLGNCTWFDLSENKLNGSLPVSTGPKRIGLDNLTSAIHFHLNNNSFTGSLPAEFSVLPNLIHLLVDSNNMNGTIPREIGEMKALTILRLDNNKFSGAFPNVSNVKTLTEIHIRNNSFTSFPDFSPLSELMFLSLGMNPFPSQQVPSFETLTKLRTLEMDRANLFGNPSRLLSLPALESISLAFNNLNGTLDLGNASQFLTSMDLIGNNISDLTRQPNNAPYELLLGNNPVCQNSRNIPSYVNCTVQPLSETWNPSNNCSAQSCTDDRVLNPATCTCGNPLQLTFQFNAPTFSTMTMDRDNLLREELAKGAGVNQNLVWVTSVNFTDNFRFIAFVDFFPPQGQDQLPAEQGSFILRRFTLHTVDLEGFDPYHVSPLDINIDVGGGSSNGGLKAGAIAGISVAVILVVCVGVYALIQKFRADKAVQVTNPFASWGGGKDNGEAPVIKGVRSFSFAELKKATENFSERHEIGVGGYGKVYKGYLLTGEVVAIKRAEAGSMQGALEFKTEIELLSRLHHKNLVGLIGFCYEQGQQMLVYEYMPNGTIRDHLNNHSKILSWNRRIEIALGAARGLSYLHELANPPIIHRDIKSSNILLDETFVAKVADLGLSKISTADEGKTHVTTQVKGTLGYLDPEYYMTQQLTDKSDVYSFGVVLLELLTARPPIEDGKYIVREIRNALRNGLAAVLPMLDSSLEGYSKRDIEIFLGIALSCVEESASRRPSMNEIVKQLEELLCNGAGAIRTVDPSNDENEFRTIDLYDDERALRSSAFEYSGAYTVPHRVEPK